MIDSQDFFSKAQADYVVLKEKIKHHFQETYLVEGLIEQQEAAMLPLMKKELRKMQWQRFRGENPLMEVKKVVQFFYYRERGEKVSFKDMNNYVKEFLNRQNADIFVHSPFEGKPLHEALVELLNIRLKLPPNGPDEIFKIWLPEQFQQALDIIPEPILEEGGFGKVCRVLGGVFLYALTGLDKAGSDGEVKTRMELAVKGGYYYGMFYPLVDDLMDHPEILTHAEKKLLIKLLDHWIVGDFSLKNELNLKPYIQLLEDIFKDFHRIFTLEDNPVLFHSALMLYFAQNEDGKKKFDAHYTMEEIYIPVIIKAAYTRILAASISGIEISGHLLEHMHKIGLNLQLMDDFRDWYTDYQHRQFTPFTYYLLGPSMQEINPFALYLTTLRVHFARYHDDPYLVNMLMRRLSISIQRFNEGNTDEKLDHDIWKIINTNKRIGKIVKKIHHLKFKVFDPDIEFTRPVDHIVNRGKNT